MLDVPVPAATVFDGLVHAPLFARTPLARDCVCFHADSSLSLNFNHAAIGSRAASRLSLTRWRGSSDCPLQISPKPNGQPAAGLPCLPMIGLLAGAVFRTAQLTTIQQPDECEVIGMYQRANNYLRNYLRRFGERCDSVVCQGRCGQGRLPRCCRRQKSRRASYLASLLLLTLTTHPVLAQEKSPGPLKGINVDIAADAPALSSKRRRLLRNGLLRFRTPCRFSCSRIFSWWQPATTSIRRTRKN